MGEMMLFYATSDVAFVGGSLKPIGGHNLLEPAALELPVLTGPYLHNFFQISEWLLKAQGACITHNSQELADTVSSLLQNEHQRKNMGNAAKSVVEANRGALNKHLAIIKIYSNNNITNYNKELQALKMLKGKSNF